ncbi:MAG TPA: S9 family peptidase [Caulobacteraceae bacterium]|nr:S9 family peptidase [Caulobacteraceae bacterium]
MRPGRGPAALIAGALILLVAPAAGAQTAAALRTFGDVALAPGADRVASIEIDQPFATPAARPRGPVVIRDAKSGTVLASLDPCGACRYSGLAWSADGASLVFLAYDSAAGRTTLEAVAGGRVQPLSVVDGVADTPRFSPDGRQIALLATPGAHKQSGAVEAGAAQVGDIGALDTADERRIAVVSAAGGELRYVSPPDSFVYEYDWTPDGRGFVATAAKGNGDNNWWIAKLEAFDLAGGPGRVIAAPAIQMDFPRVSPDGRTVAFIGGLMSDFGSVGGDLWTVPLAGGAPVDITGALHATVTSLAPWRGGRLAASVLRGSQAEVVLVDPRSGAIQSLWSAPVSLGAADGQVSFDARQDVMAAQTQDFTHPPEISVGRPGSAFVPVTSVNAGLPAQASVRSVSWKSDGLEAQGWLLAPLHAAPGLHPMVVGVHGGPSAAITPHYVPPFDPANFPLAEWLKRGFYVFYANPRGSYGQGEAFTRANIRDFGGGDLRDILAGVDAVEAIAPIDDARLGVFGHSYGGYMTMWAVTHSHRFAAAITGAGISDWISYYGENGIDQWMTPFFGATAYDDPAIYEKLSPIFAIKAARTPTLIYVGERDVECPSPQSFEFWRGLQAVGVATQFVVYAGQGHAIHDPADLADLRKRELDWFDRYLSR